MAAAEAAAGVGPVAGIVVAGGGPAAAAGVIGAAGLRVAGVAVAGVGALAGTLVAGTGLRGLALALALAGHLALLWGLPAPQPRPPAGPAPLLVRLADPVGQREASVGIPFRGGEPAGPRSRRVEPAGPEGTLPPAVEGTVPATFPETFSETFPETVPENSPETSPEISAETSPEISLETAPPVTPAPAGVPAPAAPTSARATIAPAAVPAAAFATPPVPASSPAVARPVPGAAGSRAARSDTRAGGRARSQRPGAPVSAPVRAGTSGSLAPQPAGPARVPPAVPGRASPGVLAATATPTIPLDGTALTGRPSPAGPAAAGPADGPAAHGPVDGPAAPIPPSADGSRLLRARLRALFAERCGYPPLARRSGWEGTVRMEVQVHPDGRLGSVRLVAGSGHTVLDDWTLRVARDLKELPEARRWLAGAPVQTVVAVEYRLLDPRP